MRMISENSNLIRESGSIRRKTAHDWHFRYPPESYVRYLNDETVQAAIGAYVNYTEQSVAVANAFNTTGDDGRLDGTTTDVLALVEQGVAVTMIYGDADYNSNWLGGEAVYNSIRVPGYSTPGYVDISTSDLVVHGQAKQSGAFAFARIYESGHEVPYYQPLTALAIFERTIYRYDIATGEDLVNRGFVTVGPAESTFREGNATVKFALGESGGETIVDATTYENVVGGESAPSRQLLAELEAVAKGKHAMANATAYGNVLEVLKETGEEKDPIHVKKRGGKMRRGGLMRDDVTGVENDGFSRRGLHDSQM